MTPSQAIDICRDEFPDGLTAILQEFDIKVDYCPINVDGWKFETPDGLKFIRISSQRPATRQKFTLAHELAHFLLNSGSSLQVEEVDVLDPRNHEERAANNLAVELLLPRRIVMDAVPDPYIERNTVKNLAKRAGVSEIVVANRILGLRHDLSIPGIAVAQIVGDTVKWKAEERLNLGDANLLKVYQKSAQMPMHTNRYAYKHFQLNAVSFVNPCYQFVLIHILDDAQANKHPFRGATRRELEEQLFRDKNFQNVLNGRISACRLQVKGMELEEAVGFMIDRYDDPRSWNKGQYELFLSGECYQYLMIRFEEYI